MFRKRRRLFALLNGRQFRLARVMLFRPSGQNRSRRSSEARRCSCPARIEARQVTISSVYELRGLGLDLARFDTRRARVAFKTAEIHKTIDLEGLGCELIKPIEISDMA